MRQVEAQQIQEWLVTLLRIMDVHNMKVIMDADTKMTKYILQPMRA